MDEVFPLLYSYVYGASQLPRHLLDKFLSLRYLAVVNPLGPSQLL
jgi:hypothetical protein